MLLVQLLHALLLACLVVFLLAAWRGTLAGRSAATQEEAARRLPQTLRGKEMVISPSSEVPLCRFQVLDGPQQGQEFHLTAADFPASIGRISPTTRPALGLRDCDAHRGISRHHARLEHEDGAFYLIDEGSSNGTWINDRRLTPGERCPLAPGDQVSLAQEIRLRFDRPPTG